MQFNIRPSKKPTFASNSSVAAEFLLDKLLNILSLHRFRKSLNIQVSFPGCLSLVSWDEFLHN